MRGEIAASPVSVPVLCTNLGDAGADVPELSRTRINSLSFRMNCPSRDWPKILSSNDIHVLRRLSAPAGGGDVSGIFRLWAQQRMNMYGSHISTSVDKHQLC